MPNPESDSRPEYEIRQFNFKNVPETSEFKNFRLKAFKTPDGWEDISTWKDIYRSFCQYVFNCKPNQIKALKDLDDTFLSRNVMFSSRTDYLYDAFKLKTNFYVEQRLSSSGIVDIIKKLIYYCRLPASQFIVRYEAPVTEDASESEPSSEPEPSAGLQSVPVLPKLPCFTIDNPPTLKNTGSKPVSIKFGLRLNNWNDVLEEVVRFIDCYYPECIDDIYDDYGPKGKVRKLILAKSKRSFTNSSSTKAPRFIRQNLYVKADLATDDVIQLAAAFLSYCDISLSDVLVEYRPKNLVVPELPLAPSSDAQHDDAEPEPDDELDESDDDDYYEFDNDLASGLSDKDIKDIYDDEEEDEDFDDDGDVIGFQFYDNGKPVITPWLQKFIDAIEENYPEGIDFDNIDNIATIELASGERCDEDAIALLKMALFKNEEGFYYVPLRIADESTVKAMADFIDNGIRQYNAVSLSVINEKFQDQLDYECDNEELAEFVEWYVFKEIDRLIAIEFNDSDDDGVCLLDSETTDEFCENFYGQIESYLEKTDSPVPMSQLRQLYPTLNETIISYALGDDRFGYSIQEEEKDGQLFYSVRSDSQLNDKAADLVESEQTPQTPPPPENSYFNLDDSIPDLTNAKALSISFGEKEFEILSWSGIVLQTAIYIDQNEPDAFNSLIEQYGQPNSKPHLFSHDKFEKLSCKPVNSDYYVNTNFCATTAVKTAQLFLDSCKLPLSEVRIEYLPPGKISNTRTANDVNSAEDSSRQGVSIDDSSFTKPVNKSMFETCVVVPTQLHELFLSHLSAVPDPGKNVPVTIWFNSTAYQAVIYTPDFSVCGAPPQVRFTWSPSSPIAKALKNECPESYQLLQGRARVSKENVPDEITVSCSSNLDEFIMRVNHRRARVSEPQPEAPSLFERSEEEVSLLCQTILHRAQNMFPNNSCHETQLGKMRSTFAEGEFTSDKELLDFITQNHLGVYSSKWVYFLTRAVEDCLLKILEELQQEGQIMAYYNLLYDNKQDLFDSISVFKDETAISGLFSVLAVRSHYRIVNPFYPTPSYVALKEDCTIKDALINYFEHNTVLKYDQIKSAFPYIPDTEIQETLRSDNDFILLENGSFTYYDKIYIDKALADKLLEKVVSEIEKEDFISCNQIDLSPARVNNSAEISSRGLLDYFCKKILPAKYKRIGNVISDASKPVSSSAIIEKLCETKDYVTLDELKALADELSASWQTAFATAFEKMVRVDKDRFVSPSLIQFDVEEIDKVLEDNFVLSNDFIPLQDVTNFAVFPQYDSFSWNWFLLESFCRKYSKKFGFMVAVPNSQNVGAIVKKSANFGDYTELMANAVINDEIELSEDAVGRFLIGAHYIAIVKQNSIQNVLAKAQVLLEERG